MLPVAPINGEYKLQGPLLYEGKPVKRWDMGTFQDTDGKGYLLFIMDLSIV